MNIHEYQGKAILKSFGVRVQEGIVADTVDQAVEAAKKAERVPESDGRTGAWGEVYPDSAGAACLE